MIGKRISNRSSGQEQFDRVRNDYNQALKESGYSENIEYTEACKKKKSRKRKVVWYNPPFCLTVQTNIERIFINLVKKHFDKKNPLTKLFNKNNMRVSYSCMPNMKDYINAHNKWILRNENENYITEPCNCREPDDCPVKPDSCRSKNIIYQAEVISEEENRNYIGLTSTEFKKRYANHKASFRHEEKKLATSLSKYIWELKNKNTSYKINWKIMKKVKNNQIGNTCKLCLFEAIRILRKNKECLNKRSEILNKCRHQNDNKLKYWTKAKSKWKDET